ncbi:hypothetical protein [Desulfovibrio sp. MES5]|uniref:hypothetical protein n=1 Tax=Desulfovibrio sp. MES5 TaxID=1899016 RepID=UPI0025C325B5|nr:hypothetical protein [Desulfovibrio sp. MES5]
MKHINSQPLQYGNFLEQIHAESALASHLADASHKATDTNAFVPPNVGTRPSALRADKL